MNHLNFVAIQWPERHLRADGVVVVGAMECWKHVEAMQWLTKQGHHQ